MEKLFISNIPGLDEFEDYLCKIREGLNLEDFEKKLYKKINIKGDLSKKHVAHSEGSDVFISVEIYQKLNSYYTHAFLENQSNFYDFIIMKNTLAYKEEFSKKEFKDNLQNIMFELSLLFLIYHELGHILHGHLEYINTEEANYNQRQILEYHADDFALTQYLERFSTSATLAKLSKEYNLSFGRHHWCLIIFSSISILLSLAYTSKNMFSSINNQMHLPYQIRSLIIIYQFAKIYDYLNNSNIVKSQEDLIKWHIKIGKHIDFFKQQTGIDEDADTLNYFNQNLEVQKKHAIEIEEEYEKNIEDMLKDYSHLDEILEKFNS